MLIISIMQNTDQLKGRLHLLPSLLALLEEASVTGAARRMNVTQPAMSRTLEQLRRIFEDPLLVRFGSDMQLTPRAEDLLGPLSGILSAAGGLLAKNTFEPLSARRVFRGIIPDALAGPLLPRILEELAASAPGCTLQLKPWADALRNATELDFVITSEVEHFPSLKMQPLGRDRDVLASAAKPPRGADVLQLDHVAVVASGLPEDPVDRWLREHGLSRRIRTTVPHYLLALYLVARSGLCAILPSRMVATMGAGLGVGAYELPIEQEADQLWLLYPARLEVDPASRWFRGLVVAASREERCLGC